MSPRLRTANSFILARPDGMKANPAVPLRTISTPSSHRKDAVSALVIAGASGAQSALSGNPFAMAIRANVVIIPRRWPGYGNIIHFITVEYIENPRHVFLLNNRYHLLYYTITRNNSIDNLPLNQKPAQSPAPVWSSVCSAAAFRTPGSPARRACARTWGRWPRQVRARSPCRRRGRSAPRASSIWRPA
jgi:hypothetical protein